MFLCHKKYIFLLLLAVLGLSNALYAQKIVIREADSSWMGQEIPAKALAEKKFTFNRRWFQNLITRFNYYYNARQNLQTILRNAAAIHQDNYDSLLTFYPHSPSDFQMFRQSLDSVVFNAGLGIEVHDPRGKWIDDLYLLIGKAYYYLQNDSEAIATFQYMIKNLAPKDEMGRPELVGTRAYHSTKNISIVSPEKNNRSHPPARNDAFIWLIKANLDSGRYDQATALMNALQADPQLPERLRVDLYAVQAQYHLDRGQVDSAIAPLQSAIALQKDKRLQARWQFVLSQLYTGQKKWDKAIAGFQRVEQFRPAPLMKFYARLSQIRIRVLQNLANFAVTSRPLLDMAKKERYARYRSIIYYNLGKLALQAGKPEQGIAFLKKSLLFNPKRKNTHYLSFALLADYFYKHREYRPAKNYYDSAATIVPVSNPVITLRKTALATIVKNLDVIVQEDSLQALARLPHDSLMAFLNHIVEDSMRARRKRNRILKGPSRNKGGLFGHKAGAAVSEKSNSKNGTWYFYNNVAKSKGFTSFKAQWGNRPLADNWRLSNPNQPVLPDREKTKPMLFNELSRKEQDNNQAEKLLQKLLDPLPLDKDAVAQSEKKQMDARHQNINTFFLQLEDDTATLISIDSMLRYHPENPYLAAIYYKLYLIYSRIPDPARANHYKTLLLSRFPDSKYAKVFQEKPKKIAEKALDKTIMHLYDSAYICYLTGSYGEVVVLQDSASSLDPGNKQKGRFSLLHAMAVFKARGDSAGEIALQRVIRKNAVDTPIVKQARLILNALQHKKELVEHLMHLQLPEEKPAPAIVKEGVQKETPALPMVRAIAADKAIRQKQQEALNIPAQADKANGLKMDDSQKARLRAQAVKQLPVSKVLQQPGRETVNVSVQPAQANQPGVDSAQMAAIRAEAVQQLDGTEKPAYNKDSIAVTDSARKAVASLVTPYKIERKIPYFVVLSFRKTNGDLINKTLQSFVNYNRKYHKEDSIEASSYVLAHNQVILIFRLFRDEAGALIYYKELKEKAPSVIIPGVPDAYYRLFFISRSNFILLNNTQDFEGYLNFFYKHYK